MPLVTSGLVNPQVMISIQLFVNITVACKALWSAAAVGAAGPAAPVCARHVAHAHMLSTYATIAADAYAGIFPASMQATLSTPTALRS
jgi:hypothetical protein